MLVFRSLRGWLLAATTLTWVAHAADWPATPLPQYDRLFQRTNDWTGADGDFAVTLTNGLTLWLFSDTFVGRVQDGHRTHTTMIHNSAAWQHGRDPATATVEFFHRQTADGKPAALITPADGHGWFWPFDAVTTHGRLYLFLQQIESTADDSAFGFRPTGVTLGEVLNPLDPPTQWHLRQQRLPYARFGGAENRDFGSALLATNGYLYVYGCRDHPGAGKTMILARAPATDVLDFPAWQFRTRTGWTNDVSALADLCPRLASEYSVSWLPALQRYVLVCTDNGLSDKIIARTAPDPWGPWSESRVLYHCPETTWGSHVFCYAAKAHPGLALEPGEFLLTYAANSFALSEVIHDARLYWPRFVKVQVQ